MELPIPPLAADSIPDWPVTGPEEIRSVTEVLESGAWNSATGHFVADFEAHFAEYHDCPEAVAIANGTVALIAALAVLDLAPGTEVIVPSYTFFATAAAPLALGLVPVYCDIEASSYQLDPVHLETLINERTGAVIPVHLAGAVGEMHTIVDLAGRFGVPVIEDAAQAVGVHYLGRPLPVGDMATFSFQSSKNMAAGEGGIIITRDERLGERLRSYVNVGRVPGGGWYEHRNFGLNLRMTEFQGAILLAQLARHPEWQRRRQAGAEYLHGLLDGLVGMTLPPVSGEDGSSHGQHLFMMQFKGIGAARRDRMIALLRAAGLNGAAAGYVPLHLNDALRQQRHRVCGFAGRAEPHDHCPRTELASQETIWLPQPVLLAEPAVLDRVAELITHCLAMSAADLQIGAS